MLKKRIIKIVLASQAHGTGMNYTQSPDKTIIYKGEAVTVRL